ncbi:MAG: hypothetical protein EBS93_09125 [Chitinophagia bacterium]|nr:hypothetical protein [Chitinophagia bacterium]NCA30864.1 hypothetical protein [Chitinophagia bacterium]
MDDLYSKNLLTKRFQTTMIGALYEFEKVFGYLWGHDKDEKDLTEKELDFLDRWDMVRNQILNNGNNQLRKTLSDLAKNQGRVTYKYRFNTNRKEDGL